MLQAARQVKRPTDTFSTLPSPPLSAASRAPVLSLTDLPKAGTAVPALTAMSEAGQQPPPLRAQLTSDRIERMELPPLPVIPGEVYPAVQYELAAENLELAAYECLLLAIKLPPVRIEDVHVVRPSPHPAPPHTPSS